MVEDVEALGAMAMAVQADVSVHAEAENIVKSVVEGFGRLDIMVCNAGITRDGVIWKMTEEQWDQVIGVNLKGYFSYNQAAALHFKEMKYGKIVNISSINGMRGKFAQANYAASKGGVIALSKSSCQRVGAFQRQCERGGSGNGPHRDDGEAALRVQSRGHGRDRSWPVR